MSRTNFDDTAPGGLSVVGLSKAFKRRKVLTDVSMHLNRGEVVALLGPNGAGKTTSFYSIAGMISVDTGSVSIDGRDVTNLPMYRRARLGLGYLPQEASIFRGMTVEQNIASVIELWEPTRANQRRRTEQLMEEFSVAQLRNSPAMALSGGERRRVEIARCLAGNPNYVLLDEPFAGVDPIAVGDIRTLVAQLKSRDIGVLITDHNVRETLEIIDRAYILYGGEVLMSGSPEEVVKNKDVRRVYLGNEFQV
ncbi:MAG: LPS export ABC transporter ATP-binding protein [Rhodobacteraceae bacterium]|nr:LPS export ABC transporter ATP-binding protein [Paracoccaceae bacterium]